MKQLIKKILGQNKQYLKTARNLYHGQKARIAALKNRYPAKKLLTVGITGTKGKTSTTVVAGELLKSVGVKVGYISTAQICDGDSTFPNPYHMTTIDAVKMQNLLAKMVKNGCEVVVLEMSSQGMEQGRHFGLNGFDVGVLLNLYPEHIESHGSFENYMAAKQVLFKKLREDGVAIINKKSDKYEEFAKLADKENLRLVNTGDEIGIKENGIYKNIVWNENEYPTKFKADFEIENLWIAIQICRIAAQKLKMREKNGQKIQSQSDFKTIDLLEKAGGEINIPGRMEMVVEGKNFDIMVDYAHEPASIKSLLKTLEGWKNAGFYDKIIHVVSCDGAGRDDWKKPVMGKLSYMYADCSIYTTDNYEDGDSPEEIVEMLLKNIEESDIEKAEKTGKIIKNVDRREAFEDALKMAQFYSQKGKKSLIVSTGVGNENGLTRPNGKMDWDEKKVWQVLSDTLS